MISAGEEEQPNMFETMPARLMAPTADPVRVARDAMREEGRPA
jgi:hypothetical protein